MNAQRYDEVENSIDEANEIFVGEESDGKSANNSKQCFMIENDIPHVSSLELQDNDFKGDENQELKGRSIENRTLLGIRNQTEERRVLARKAHTYPCKDAYKLLPEHPSRWPQRPLMIRPTPHSSTKVIGIRLAGRDDYEDFMGFSAGCILPINNGREAKGESIVVDFESTHFVGTLLLRIKQVPPVPRGRDEKSCSNEDESNICQNDRNSQRDYFANKKRKFQAVIKGRFKTPLSMSRCVTGQIFERPAGKLPAQWVVKNFIKFVSILAPQLDASLDGNMPRFLTPLVATAQTVLADNKYEKSCPKPNDRDLINRSPPLKHGDRHRDLDTGGDLEEPPSLEPNSALSALDAGSELGITIPDTTSYSLTNRSLARKKVFNALCAKRSPEPQFDTNKVYTFEFYQHLLDFGDELAVDMGRIGGMVPLAQAMDGQPLKVMAAYRSSEIKQELDSLWSFDIFHESLYSYAQMAFE